MTETTTPTADPGKDAHAAVRGELGILARRRIEAAIIAPIYEEMRARLGEETAQSILDEAIRKAAVAAGQSFAAKTPGGTDLRSFQDLQVLWTQEDALVTDVLHGSIAVTSTPGEGTQVRVQLPVYMEET